MDSKKRHLIVRRFETREEVKRLNVTEKSDRAVERIMSGMLINMDTDRFYIEDTDDAPNAVRERR